MNNITFITYSSKNITVKIQYLNFVQTKEELKQAKEVKPGLEI